MRRSEAYSLAHTARCKLQLAADRPDRNLRFILGHAFTLDKLNFRLTEIETGDGDEEDSGDELSRIPGDGGGERFCILAEDLDTVNDAKGSEPPSGLTGHAHDSEDNALYEDADEEARDLSLSLQRFGTNSARSLQKVDDASTSSSSSSSDEEEYDFDFPSIMPSDDAMRQITTGPDDAQLQNLYQHVAKCPCHGKNGDQIEHMWKFPQKEGQFQLAIMQISA